VVEAVTDRVSAYDRIVHALQGAPEVRPGQAEQLVDAVLHEAATRQRSYGYARYAIADADRPSARRKKEVKLGVVEMIAALIDPWPPELVPRRVRVHPLGAGWLVRWRLGGEDQVLWCRTREAADAYADRLAAQAAAGKDTPTGGGFTRTAAAGDQLAEGGER
jgi:hypothetical protein